MEDYTEELKYFFNSDIDKDNDKYIVKDIIGHCIELILDIDIIHVLNLNRCEMNGTTIIERTVLFANTNNFKEIILDDQSYLTIRLSQGDEYFDFRVDLASLSILATGESWYNRLGFRQENYNKDIVRWNDIRNKTFIELLDELYSLSNDERNFDSKNHFHSPFFVVYLKEFTNEDKAKLFPSLIEIMLDDFSYVLDKKVKDIASLILTSFRTRKYIEENEIELRKQLVYIGILSYLLKYERQELTLNI